jgi:hypothetical protein
MFHGGSVYKFLLSLILIVFSFSVFSASDDVSKAWLTLIKNGYSEDCSIEPPEVESSLVGNNGFITEKWVLTTCHGVKLYQVSFYPKMYFPKRKLEFVVELVK